MTGIIKWIKGNQQVVVILAISGMVVLIMGVIIWARRPVSEPVKSPVQMISDDSQTASSSEVTPIYADIKGAVVSPGMYQLPQNARVFDLINMAGGFTEEAVQDHVNLAQLVVDQAVVYVPTSSEDLATWQEGQGGLTGEKESTSAKVNLNTADLSELQQLNGIGEKKASAIIAYREENGSFKSIDELKKVGGIGEKTFENLKEEIEV